MMKTSIVLSLILTMAWLPLGAAAQTPTPLSEHPGYFPLDDLEIFDPDDLSVEVNLQGAMLKLVAMATSDDPEFSQLISGIKAIRVQVAEVAAADLDAVSAAIGRGRDLLEERGWLRIVWVRDGDEEVYIYNREENDTIVGMTVLVLSSDEATIVNLVGKVDPEMLGSLAIGLDIPQLGRALEAEQAEGNANDD